MLLVACGTSHAPSEEAPVETREVVEPTVHQEPSNETRDETAALAMESPEAAPLLDGPSNFVTPHHCHPPGPCTFEFEALQGAQHIDVGHGHPEAPNIDVVLLVSEGSARIEGLRATPGDGLRATVIARPRDSLEGGAFYVTLDGDASTVELELSFHGE